MHGSPPKIVIMMTVCCGDKNFLLLSRNQTPASTFLCVSSAIYFFGKQCKCSSIIIIGGGALTTLLTCFIFSLFYPKKNTECKTAQRKGNVAGSQAKVNDNCNISTKKFFSGELPTKLFLTGAPIFLLLLQVQLCYITSHHIKCKNIYLGR